MDTPGRRLGRGRGRGRRRRGSYRGRARTGPIALLIALALCAAPADPGAAQPVNIGLIVPGQGPLAEVGRAVQEGAVDAVRRANDEGGYGGRPFQLVVRSDDGAWGAGMSRVTSLFFDDDVVAVIGGIDGRSAHLIQQVATKARIPLIAPWASDRTLSRGFVPWFFQIVPDDRQQMSAVVAALATDLPIRVAVIADGSYDSKMALDELRRAANGRSGVILEVVPPAPTEPWARFAAVVLLPRTDASLSQDLLQAWSGLDLRIYVHSSAATPDLLRTLSETGNAVLVPTFSSSTTMAAKPIWPGALAADYAYDAVAALVTAIRAAGVEAFALRDALSSITIEDARTGPVRFDSAGRREGHVRIVAFQAR